MRNLSVVSVPTNLFEPPLKDPAKACPADPANPSPAARFDWTVTEAPRHVPSPEAALEIFVGLVLRSARSGAGSAFAFHSASSSAGGPFPWEQRAGIHLAALANG